MIDNIVTIDSDGIHPVSKDSEMAVTIQEIFKDAERIPDIEEESKQLETMT